MDMTSVHIKGNPIDILWSNPMCDLKISMLYNIDSNNVTIAITQENKVYCFHLISGHCLIAMNIGAMEKEIDMQVPWM